MSAMNSVDAIIAQPDAEAGTCLLYQPSCDFADLVCSCTPNLLAALVSVSRQCCHSPGSGAVAKSHSQSRPPPLLRDL